MSPFQRMDVTRFGLSESRARLRGPGGVIVYRLLTGKDSGKMTHEGEGGT